MPRQFLQISITLSKSVKNITIIRDYQLIKVSLSNTPEIEEYGENRLSLESMCLIGI